MMPNGHIVIAPRRRLAERAPAPTRIGIVPFADARLRAGLRHGHRQGRRLQAHPRVLPATTSGAVGGLVGMLGGLGGFFLPPLFAYTKAWSGFPSSTFFVLFLLTAACSVWMHWTVVRHAARRVARAGAATSRPRPPQPTATADHSHP